MGGNAPAFENVLQWAVKSQDRGVSATKDCRRGFKIQFKLALNLKPKLTFSQNDYVEITIPIFVKFLRR